MAADVQHLNVSKNVGKAGALLHSLVPRAQCFCFYDVTRQCGWSSDGAEDYEVDTFVADLPDEVVAELGESEEVLRRTLNSGRTLIALPVYGEDRGRIGMLMRVAEDLAGAMAQRATLAPHESIITRDGLWLGPNWLRVTRLADQSGGVIQRQQELEALERNLTELERRESQLDSSVAANQQRLAQLEEQRQQSQRELQASTRQHAEASARLSAHQAKLEQINAHFYGLDGTYEVSGSIMTFLFALALDHGPGPGVHPPGLPQALQVPGPSGGSGGPGSEAHAAAVTHRLGPTVGELRPELGGPLGGQGVGIGALGQRGVELVGGKVGPVAAVEELDRLLRGCG